MTLLPSLQDLEVRHLMTDRVFSVASTDPLLAVRDLMVEHAVRHVPVVDKDGDLVGLISHRDLLRSALVEQVDTPDTLEREVLSQLAASDLMTTTVETVDADTPLREAARLMVETKYGCLPVTEGPRLVGILTESDFVRLVAEVDEVN